MLGTDYGKATITFATTQVFAHGYKSSTYEDLDLSAVIGAKQSLVMLKVTNASAATPHQYFFRRNGATDDLNDDSIVALFIDHLSGDGSVGFLLVTTDTNGVVEWATNTTTTTEHCQVDMEAYIQ